MTEPDRRRVTSTPRSALAAVLSVMLALPAHATGNCEIPEPSATGSPRTNQAQPSAREVPWVPDPRLQIYDQVLSSPQALDRMLVIEGPAEAAAVASAVRSALPPIERALALAEVGQTIREHIPAGRPPAANPVLIRFMPAGSDLEDEAEASALCTRFSLQCSVEIYQPFWSVASNTEIAFTLAHELFHIAQTLAFPAILQDCTNWWVEGSAEWFANLAFHGRPYTRLSGYLEDWERLSPTTSLTGVSYEAVAFFFWASERFGPGFPLTLGAFGVRGIGATRQLGTTLSLDDWTDFATTNLDGRLRYPDGRWALRTPNLGPVTAADGGAILITGPLLSIPRQRVTVEPGIWRFELVEIDPGSVALMRNEAGGWDVLQTPGSSVARFFDCNRGGEMVIAVAGGTGEATGATFAVTRDDGDCNSCVIGQWSHIVDRTDAESAVGNHTLRMTGVIRRHFEGGFEDTQLETRDRFLMRYNNVYPVLTLRPDGMFHYDDPFSARSDGVDDRGRPFWYEIHRTVDSIQGEWRDVRGRLMMRNAVRHIVQWRSGSDPMFYDRLRRSEPAWTPVPNGVTIRCTGGSMFLQMHPGSGPDDPPIGHHFERL